MRVIRITLLPTQRAFLRKLMTPPPLTLTLTPPPPPPPPPPHTHTSMILLGRYKHPISPCPLLGRCFAGSCPCSLLVINDITNTKCAFFCRINILVQRFQELILTKSTCLSTLMWQRYPGHMQHSSQETVFIFLQVGTYHGLCNQS